MIPLLPLLWALGASPGPQDLKGLGPVPADAVRILLVRHGQAFSNLNPKPALPPPELDRLTDLGRAQARRTAEVVRGQGVTLVLTSPAHRARETAEILRSVLGAPPVPVEPRVRPFELGRSPSGKALGWDEREAEWKLGRDPVPEGGESLRQLADRVLDLVAALARTRPGQAVVAITHGEVIAAIVGAVQGRPPQEWEDLSVENASLTVIEAAAGKPPKVVLVNVSSERTQP